MLVKCHGGVSQWSVTVECHGGVSRWSVTDPEARRLIEILPKVMEVPDQGSSWRLRSMNG
eukprot:1393130-Amorphochlora_amoeboformis.AAC.1